MRSTTTRAAIAVAAATAAALSVGGLAPDQAGAPAKQPSLSAVAAAPDPELTAALNDILDDPRLVGSMASLVVRDAATGETLYEQEPGRRLNPASNAKLFTSTAALDTLGTDYTFVTDARAVGRIDRRSKTLRGDLYLHGGGDPTMLAEDYADLASQLADRGIQRVSGDLLVDDSFFDEVPLGVAWSWDDEAYYYSGVTSALTVSPDTDYDSGSVIVETSHGRRVGSPVTVGLVPQTSVVRINNLAKTGPAGSDNTLSVDRRHGSRVIDITGSMPIDDGPSQDWATVPNPTAYAVDVFRQALRAEDISIGATRASGTPGYARVIAAHESMSLADLLIPFMKLSNNMHAEALVKTMGREVADDGSWDAGLDVVAAYAEEQGVDTSVLRLSDGSGLSRFDLVSAQNVSDLLVGVRGEPWFDTWYDSLPIAGNPDRFVGGTLRSRMAGTPAAENLHAKTGSLTSVTALSGYVSNADGRALVFSMISNNYLSSPRSLEDAVGITLASWTEEDGGEVATVDVRDLRRTTTYGPAGIECSWAKAC